MPPVASHSVVQGGDQAGAMAGRDRPRWFSSACAAPCSVGSTARGGLGVEVAVYWRIVLLDVRPDLDGCIELAPAGQQHTIDSIAVTSPADAFGWLHPAYQHPFVLDESCWHSAKISDWPWPLRKALQSHHEPERFYRETLSRALGARFRQTPSLRQRLLALRYPVQINDVPDGLIQEVAVALRNDSLAGLAR